MRARQIATVAPGNVIQVLFRGTNLDMTLTTDQALTKLFSGTNWATTAIFGVRKSGAFGVSCAGGIYTTTAKGGTAIVAAVQSWAALTGAGTSTQATIAAGGIQTTAALYLSLTTGNTGALAADIFVCGHVLD